jgi:decaprenylphospho-beta-D-erythro-pentofuranosid-2-ulose 2-reductase
MSGKGAVLILGARSDIARACARRFAKEGHALQLAARDAASLEAEATDLRLRGAAQVSLHEFDVLETESFPAFLDSLPDLPRVAICAVGMMGDQMESQRNPAAAAAVMRSNFEGPAAILGLLAERMDESGRGVIVGISSVAGERGRASNYVYGAAKAGFTAWLSGLRNRLAKGPVHVVTVLPGFVATRMTEGMELNERLLAAPEEVAEAIFQAVARRRDVIYVRRIWWLIMAIIRALPERVFKKTSL